MLKKREGAAESTKKQVEKGLFLYTSERDDPKFSCGDERAEWT